MSRYDTREFERVTFDDVNVIAAIMTGMRCSSCDLNNDDETSSQPRYQTKRDVACTIIKCDSTHQHPFDIVCSVQRGLLDLVPASLGGLCLTRL